MFISDSDDFVRNGNEGGLSTECKWLGENLTSVLRRCSGIDSRIAGYEIVSPDVWRESDVMFKYHCQCLI